MVLLLSIQVFELLRSVRVRLFNKNLELFRPKSVRTGQYLWEYGTGKREVAGAKIYCGPILKQCMAIYLVD